MLYGNHAVKTEKKHKRESFVVIFDVDRNKTMRALHEVFIRRGASAELYILSADANLLLRAKRPGVVSSLSVSFGLHIS